MHKSRMGFIVMVAMVDVMVGFAGILLVLNNRSQAEIVSQVHQLEVKKTELEVRIAELDKIKADKESAAQAVAKAEKAEAERMAKEEADRKAREAEEEAARERELAIWRAAHPPPPPPPPPPPREQWVSGNDGFQYDGVLLVKADGVYTNPRGTGTPMTDPLVIQAWVRLLIREYDSRRDPDHSLSIAIWVEKGANDMHYTVIDNIAWADPERKISISSNPTGMVETRQGDQ